MPSILKASALVGSIAVSLGFAVQAQVPANPDPSSTQGGTYAVEPLHTRVLFSVSHMGFTTYFGGFTGASGTLRLDPRDPAASKLDVSVPTASVTTTNAKLDGELKSADWLDASKYPAITFRSTKVTPTGPRTAEVAGDLTLHGVTRPVVLQARFNAAGVNPLDKAYTAGFEVNGTIRRGDFGVKTYIPLIGDEVTLTISAAFERGPT